MNVESLNITGNNKGQVLKKYAENELNVYTNHFNKDKNVASRDYDAREHCVLKN